MTSSNVPSGLVSFRISVDGKQIPDIVQILSISIEKNNQNKDLALIEILDGNPMEESFTVSTSDLFDSEKSISIEAGYNNQNQLLFSGSIQKQSLRINRNSGSILVITCVQQASTDAVVNETTNPESVLTITYGEDLLTFDADLGLKTFEMNGVLTTWGNNILGPGKYLTLKGLGSRFSGSQKISSVLHELKDGNWISKVLIGIKNTATEKIIRIEDQHLNSIVLSEDGISINSCKDITINALNITEKASIQYMAEGSLTTKINGGTELVLKAAMIKIN